MRLSGAQDDGRPLNNLPGRYPTEDWEVHYWDVGPQGELKSRRAVIQLPVGYDGAAPRIHVRQPGCVHRVRRWGVQLYTRLLQQIGFDPAQFLERDSGAATQRPDAQLIAILIQATHFDLPSNFVIASPKHPLLLFDPQGLLKGSYSGWYTHLGAAAYLLSDGAVRGTFGLVQAEGGALYDQALGYVLEALLRLQEG
jgi:hypothetical protein